MKCTVIWPVWAQRGAMDLKDCSERNLHTDFGKACLNVPWVCHGAELSLLGVIQEGFVVERVQHLLWIC